MRKHIATTVSLLLVFGLGACLLSLTESFEYDVFKENSITSIDLEGKDRHIESIDLRDNDTFEEHQDDIQNVDRVTFMTDLYTKNDRDAVVDIFFRLDATDPWKLLINGLKVSAASTAGVPTKITYDRSEELVENFDVFQRMAIGGVMQLGVGARTGNDEVVVLSLVLYIAISGG